MECCNCNEIVPLYKVNLHSSKKHKDLSSDKLRYKVIPHTIQCIKCGLLLSSKNKKFHIEKYHSSQSDVSFDEKNLLEDFWSYCSSCKQMKTEIEMVAHKENCLPKFANGDVMQCDLCEEKVLPRRAKYHYITTHPEITLTEMSFKAVPESIRCKLCDLVIHRDKRQSHKEKHRIEVDFDESDLFRCSWLFCPFCEKLHMGNVLNEHKMICQNEKVAVRCAESLIRMICELCGCRVDRSNAFHHFRSKHNIKFDRKMCFQAMIGTIQCIPCELLIPNSEQYKEHHQKLKHSENTDVDYDETELFFNKWLFCRRCQNFKMEEHFRAAKCRATAQINETTNDHRDDVKPTTESEAESKWEQKPRPGKLVCTHCDAVVSPKQTMKHFEIKHPDLPLNEIQYEVRPGSIRCTICGFIINHGVKNKHDKNHRGVDVAYETLNVPNNKLSYCSSCKTVETANHCLHCQGDPALNSEKSEPKNELKRKLDESTSSSDESKKCRVSETLDERDFYSVQLSKNELEKLSSEGRVYSKDGQYYLTDS